MRNKVRAAWAAGVLLTVASICSASQYSFTASLKDHVVNPPTVPIATTSLVHQVVNGQTFGVSLITLSAPLTDALPRVKVGDFVFIDLDSPDATFDGLHEILTLAADAMSFASININNIDNPIVDQPVKNNPGKAGPPPVFTRNPIVKINNTSLTAGVATITTAQDIRQALNVIVGDLVKIRLDAADPAFEGIRKITSLGEHNTFTFDSPFPDQAQKVNTGAVSKAIEPTDPVGDSISGHMSGVVNVAATSKDLPQVNTPGIDDNLAAVTVTINFKTIDGAKIKLPVGNLFDLAGTGDKKGRIVSNFQGQLTGNGHWFKFKASNLDLEKVLGIDPTKPAGNSTIIVEIAASAKDPATGAPVNVILASERVNFGYKVNANKTVKGTGKPAL